MVAPSSPVPPHHAVAVEHLLFSYPDGQTALRDLSFTLPPGEKVALVGANGSGKSTLLLHLNGILRAVSGSISIEGILLSDRTMPTIRARVGLLFQNPDDQLFSPRVYDDVAFAARYTGLNETAVQERVNRALALVDMARYSDRTPFHLSVGEKSGSRSPQSSRWMRRFWRWMSHLPGWTPAPAAS